MESDHRDRRSPLLMLAVMFAVLSCSHDTGSPTQPVQQSPLPAAGTLTLAVGQSVLVAPSIFLKVEKIVSDSRCPTGVTCVWAGETDIALSLKSGSDSEVFRLSDSARSKTINGLRFTLVSVDPYPRAEASIPVAAYRISIQVDGL